MILPVIPDHIPRPLQRRAQWVAWRQEPRANGTDTKRPFIAGTERHASTDRPETWCGFATALAAQVHYDGLGFVLMPENGYVVLDLDHCRDPATGGLTDQAQWIVRTLDAYTELSPSGEGLRIIARGTLPVSEGVKKFGDVEFYAYGKYFTVTGQHLDGTPFSLEERTQQLAEVYGSVARAQARPPRETMARPAHPVSVDDQALLDRMFAAGNGAATRALFHGDRSGYASPSEADLAFARILAFWCGRDLPHMDRLFRQSALMRAKWDERHAGDGRTYGQLTLEKAAAHCAEVYTPRPVNGTTATIPTTAPGPHERDAPAHAATDQPPPEPTPLFTDARAFLAQRFLAPTSYIDELLSDDGGGWLAGEEKLGKTFWMLHEGVCLALGLPVAGRFAVPMPRRVVIIEEEDSARRTHRRLRGIIAGLGVNPDDAKIQAQLAERLHLAVWQGFTLDDPAMVDRLDADLARLRPNVCYIDVLRKLTSKDLNKGEHAGALLGVLDRLRRRHGTLFRIVAHNRKVQGQGRAGRGSQEIAGSHQLGAWGENSLFFSPIGKEAGQVRLDIQGKDLPPAPAFRLIIESEGPADAPKLIRLWAEDLKTTSAAGDWQDRVYEALATLPPIDPALVKQGQPGVPVTQLAETVRCSEKTVRKALDLLIDAGRCLETGKLSKGKKLYGIKPL